MRPQTTMCTDLRPFEPSGWRWRAALLGVGVWAVSWANTALAISACEAPVFACTLYPSGKKVQVCERGDTWTYEFGPASGVPELTLVQRRSQVLVQPWNGMGAEYWGALEMANGAWRYRLSFRFERGVPDGRESAGVTVLRGGKIFHYLACQADTLRERIEDFAD